MQNIIEALRALLSQSASAGAPVDPRVEAMRKLQEQQQQMPPGGGGQFEDQMRYPRRELDYQQFDDPFQPIGFQDQAYPGTTGPKGIRKGDTLGHGTRGGGTQRDRKGNKPLHDIQYFGTPEAYRASDDLSDDHMDSGLEHPPEVIGSRPQVYDDRNGGTLSTEKELAATQQMMGMRPGDDPDQIREMMNEEDPGSGDAWFQDYIRNNYDIK